MGVELQDKPVQDTIRGWDCPFLFSVDVGMANVRLQPNLAMSRDQELERREQGTIPAVGIHLKGTVHHNFMCTDIEPLAENDVEVSPLIALGCQVNPKETR